jgi:hypothetical protein
VALRVGAGDDCIASGVGLGDGFVSAGVALGLAFVPPSEEALTIQSGFSAAVSVALLGFDAVVVADDATADVFGSALVGVRNCDAGSLFWAPVWAFAGTPIKSLLCPCDFSVVAVVKKSLPFLNVGAASPSPGASWGPEVTTPEVASREMLDCECP